MRDEDTPYGYCHCGCGEKTRIARITRRRDHKGQPKLFVNGHQRRRIPPVGTRFYRLVVLEFVGTRDMHVMVRCQCDCGGETTQKASLLYKGVVLSCGCTHTTHGLRQHPLYMLHANLKRRCSDPTNISYPNYGGRGIEVCERWRGPDGFPNFLADMGERPSSRHSIERIDNDGNYEPGNCRWATHTEQMFNTRRTKLTPALHTEIYERYEARGITQRELAAEYGVARETVTWIVRQERNAAVAA